MPTLSISEQLHAEKYRAAGESFRGACSRVADALKDSEAHYHAFRDCLMGGRFSPPGRVWSAIGATRTATPYNCFVAREIPDSIQGIMGVATEAAETLRLGGGIGYDFSPLRPRGERIASLDTKASGPVSFMNVFHVVNSTITGAGNRAAAQMGVLRVDHPDVLDFIRAKQDNHSLTTMNLSVGVTDEFMSALAADASFDLRWGDKRFSTVNARDLWAELMRSTWDYAEPGVLFIDTINSWNNLWYCEKIAATNPCGEQPLPPNGACLLGSFNLPAYMCWSDGAWSFDFEQFKADIPPVVRAMDNVVDRARYPLPAQELEAKSKRRMGLGVMGLANAVEAMGATYGDAAFLAWSSRILATLRDECYRASIALAEEKGVFPLWDRDKYATGLFIGTLPADVKARLDAHGIRNSHLTSLAPTGTISLTSDNVSGGIEPVFAYSTSRLVKLANGPELVDIPDYGVARFGTRGKTAGQCSVDDHLNVLLVAQRHVDSAVSKTCNVGADVPWEDFKQIYIRAWEGGAKGCTTYRSAGKRGGVLVDAAAPSAKSCIIDGSCSD